ncbi:MAG TPA: hypothetical protein VMV73_00055, partial [Candidatus Dormibacteraeota bacterium]|nr:hypothetical protein [Candidatus Dormibacteraeota bacterium]
MKKLPLLALAILVVGFFAAPVSAAPLGAIDGQITAAQSDGHLAGAIVKARLRGSAKAFSTTTSRDG